MPYPSSTLYPSPTVYPGLGGEEEEVEVETPIPPSVVGTPRRLAVPKLRVPLHLENGRLGVCEQDSPENVAAAVYAILSYERGSRVEDPEFGVESLVFDQMPVDVSEWLQQIARYEPRSSARTQQEIEDTLDLIFVEVGSTQ